MSSSSVVRHTASYTSEQNKSHIWEIQWTHSVGLSLGLAFEIILYLDSQKKNTHEKDKTNNCLIKKHSYSKCLKNGEIKRYLTEVIGIVVLHWYTRCCISKLVYSVV